VSSGRTTFQNATECEELARDLPSFDGAGPDGGGVEPLFALRHVELARGGRPVLRDLTLDLPRRAFTGIIGPSGAGKTSLIRLLNRLDDPAAGEITFLGQPLTGYDVRALRRRVAFVFQTAAMFEGTVADNLRVAAELGGKRAAAQAPEVASVLRAVGLDPEYGRREAGELSSGEQQRVSLGRALMTLPDVLLLDEPTSALDPETALHLLGTVARLAEEHAVSVIMVTHRLCEARQFTSHCVLLEGGSIVEAGSTKQLFSAASTERARAYLASGR
jgi:putative ABC transport system ATP-binding protein